MGTASLELLEPRRLLSVVVARDFGTNDANPRALVALDNTVMWAGGDALGGPASVWRFDAANGLRSQVHSSTLDLNVFKIDVIGDAAVFYTSSFPRGLWRTDSSAGTASSLANFADSSTSLTARLSSGSHGYYLIADSTGSRVWATDGDSAQIVLDRPSAVFGSGAIRMGSRDSALLGGDAVFAAKALDGTWQYVRSDGTAAGTQPLMSFAPPFSIDGSKTVGVLSDRLLFVTASGALWVTDGTVGGTANLGTSFEAIGAGVATDDGRLFFAASTSGSGDEELWVSDGSAAGTVEVADLAAGLSSSPAELFWTPAGLLFSANDGLHGRELWRSDGSAAGTVRLTDVAAGPASSDPRELVWLDGRVIFSARELSQGRELWVYDSTDSTAARLTNWPIGVQGSDPRMLTIAGDQVAFAANHPVYGSELFVSDGTVDGTQLLLDSNTAPFASNVTDGTAGREGWVSSAPVREYFPGTGVSQTFFRLHQLQGDSFVPIRAEGVQRVWPSVGSYQMFLEDGFLYAARGASVQPIQGMPQVVGFPLLYFGALSDRLIVRVASGPYTRVYAVDPVQSAAIPLLSQDDGRNARDFVTVGEHVYFVAGLNGETPTLYRTDGTPEGTVAIPTPFSADLSRGISANGTLIARAIQSDGLKLMLVRPGTPIAVVTIPGSGPGALEYRSLTTGTHAVMVTSSTAGGHIIVSDGTPTGTRRIGLSGSTALGPETVKGKVFMASVVDGLDRQMLSIDPAAGTIMRLLPASYFNEVYQPVIVGDFVYFLGRERASSQRGIYRVPIDGGATSLVEVLGANDPSPVLRSTSDGRMFTVRSGPVSSLGLVFQDTELLAPAVVTFNARLGSPTPHLAVTLDKPLAGDPSDSIAALTHLATGELVNVNVRLRADGLRLEVVLVDGLPADGRYRLVVDRAGLSDRAGNSPPADFVTEFNLQRGDMNQDGVVNNLDIAPFVAALTDPARFFVDFGYHPIGFGDVNGDGAFNNLDIAPFVALLTGGRTAVAAPAPAATPVPSRTPVRPPSVGLEADDGLVAGGTRVASGVLR